MRPDGFGKEGKMADKNQEKELTLEEAFEKLDLLVERLEDRDVPLEESFSIYKEGMELLKKCGDKIDTVEKNMRQINEDGEVSDFE